MTGNSLDDDSVETLKLQVNDQIGSTLDSLLIDFRFVRLSEPPLQKYVRNKVEFDS